MAWIGYDYVHGQIATKLQSPSVKRSECAHDRQSIISNQELSLVLWAILVDLESSYLR